MCTKLQFNEENRLKAPRQRKLRGTLTCRIEAESDCIQRGSDVAPRTADLGRAVTVVVGPVGNSPIAVKAITAVSAVVLSHSRSRRRGRPLNDHYRTESAVTGTGLGYDGSDF
ncbi:unnamed protein product [Calypogeia fissa]